MMPRHKARQISLREPKQTHRRRQTPAVLGMQWMFEPFLQMHESARCLNQPLEKIRVGRVGLAPKLFQNVVCLVVTLLIPATEKRTVTRVCCHFCVVRVRIFSGRLGQPL